MFDELPSIRTYGNNGIFLWHTNLVRTEMYIVISYKLQPKFVEVGNHKNIRLLPYESTT